MYTSRGIGRQSHNDRNHSDRSGRPDRSSYQNSPDGRQDYRSDDIEMDRKPNVYNERKDYRNSPNSYQSSSRDGYTPPGPPPPSTPSSSYSSPGPPPTPSYTPTPIYKPGPPPPPLPTQSVNYTPKPPPPPNANYTPSQPLPPPTPNAYGNQSSNNRMQPNYRPNPNPEYRPNSNYGPNSGSSYDRERDDEDQPMTQREIEEKLFLEKLDILFQDVNSIDDLVTLKEAYNDKAASLDSILQKSCLREGEIMRNKRRDRVDFKDPMLLENKKLQVDVRKKLEEVNKFKVEIDRRIRQFNKAVRDAMVRDEEEDKKKSDGNDKPSNYEAQLLQNSMITTTANDEDIDEEEDEYEYENQTKEYFDSGSHWCRDCDKMVPKVMDLFEHLHSREHWKLANNELKPWRKPKRVVTLDPYAKPKIKTAIKGAQFLIPLKGFYCPLCKEHLGDDLDAEEHLKSAKHNRIYNRFTCLNIDYEQKWNSDKTKAQTRHQTNERKKAKEEENKEIEKKRIKEEQKLKEEKAEKRKKREEENKRREREEDRDDRKKVKSETISNSSERFRLKSVTLDLSDNKQNKSSNKERGREREHKKNKKRTRIYSSSSDSSSSSSSPPRKKKQTYFGDPYKDPKLKRKSFVDLIRLNRKTAERYKCKELVKVIEESKHRKLKPKVEVMPNSPIKMEIDINKDEENEKSFKCDAVDGILAGLDSEVSDKPIETKDKENTEKDSEKDKTNETENSEKPVETESTSVENTTETVAEKSEDNNKENEDKLRAEESIKESVEEEEVIIPDNSFDSDTNNKLEIDMEVPKEGTTLESEPQTHSPNN